MTLEQVEKLSKNLSGREAMRLLEKGIEINICKPKYNNRLNNNLKDKVI